MVADKGAIEARKDHGYYHPLFLLEETVHNQHLKNAATKFHQVPLSHIQAINERRVESRNEFNNLQNSDQKMKRGILLLRRLGLWT